MLNRDSSMVDGDRLVVVGVGEVGGCSTARNMANVFS